MTCRKLILFDIDGTLLSSQGAGYRAIRRAFAAEFEDLDFFAGVRFDGKTDPQIVLELYAAAGVPERGTATATAALLDRYLGHLVDELADADNSVAALPGIMQLLVRLGEVDDACVGLLTGNIVTGAAMKLNAAGIDPGQFRLGAYGSDATLRPQLPPIAVEGAASIFGRRPVGEEIVIIGDTPADVTCGAALGVRAVAVATGSYSVADLMDAGAHATFETLADTDRVLEAIL